MTGETQSRRKRIAQIVMRPITQSLLRLTTRAATLFGGGEFHLEVNGRNRVAVKPFDLSAEEVGRIQEKIRHTMVFLVLTPWMFAQIFNMGAAVTIPLFLLFWAAYLGFETPELVSAEAEKHE